MDNNLSFEQKREQLIARADRTPTWGFSYLVFVGLGFSFFITLYDVVNIGFALPYISFVTTSSEASLAAALGLLGYAAGAPTISILADRIGRKPVLLLTATLTAVGSFGDAAAVNIPMLYGFRFLTGMGIGADLVLVMVYLTEMSPLAKRRRYVNLAFIAGWAGIGFGPFFSAQIVLAAPVTGWRYLFIIGGTIAVAVIAIRAIMPETVRYLANKGKFDEAEKLVEHMEKVSSERAKQRLVEPSLLNYPKSDQSVFKTLFSKKYRKRLSILFSFMFFQYFVDYMFLALAPSWVKITLGVTGHTYNLMIELLGIAGIGAFAGSILIRPLLERYDIRKLATYGVVGYTIGTTLMAVGGVKGNIPAFFIGATIAELLGVGFYNAYYLLNSENFPTMARATGYGMSDGLGHLGGFLGTLYFFAFIAVLGSVLTWSILWIPNLIVCILLFFFIPNARGKRLEEVNEAEAAPD